MNSTNFCYWLRGFLEVGNPSEITKEQIEIIKKHLDLVVVININNVKNQSILCNPSGFMNGYDSSTYGNYGPICK